MSFGSFKEREHHEPRENYDGAWEQQRRISCPFKTGSHNDKTRSQDQRRSVPKDPFQNLLFGFPSMSNDEVDREWPGLSTWVIPDLFSDVLEEWHAYNIEVGTVPSSNIPRPGLGSSPVPKTPRFSERDSEILCSLRTVWDAQNDIATTPIPPPEWDRCFADLHDLACSLRVPDPDRQSPLHEVSVASGDNDTDWWATLVWPGMWWEAMFAPWKKESYLYKLLHLVTSLSSETFCVKFTPWERESYLGCYAFWAREAEASQSRTEAHWVQETSQMLATTSAMDILNKSRKARLLSSMRGREALTIWKNTAGQSKSWRRCPKVVLTVHSSHHHRLSRLAEHTADLFMSRLWVPQIFEQYPYSRLFRHVTKITRLVQPNNEPRKRSRGIRDHIDGIQAIFTHSESNACIHQRSTRSPVRASNPSESSELSAAFLRLIWVKEAAMTPIVHLDRFLPTGLLLRRRWRILHFLRNDTHADVYSVQDVDAHGSRHQADVQIEAHYFMAQYHGNWRTAARRKKTRLLEREEYQTRFKYGDRYVIVLKVAQHIKTFDSRKKTREFPRLNGMGEQKLQHARCERRSYAAVLREAILDGIVAEHRNAQKPSEKVKDVDVRSLATAQGRRAEKQRIARLEKRRAKREALEQETI